MQIRHTSMAHFSTIKNAFGHIIYKKILGGDITSALFLDDTNGHLLQLYTAQRHHRPISPQRQRHIDLRFAGAVLKWPGALLRKYDKTQACNQEENECDATLRKYSLTDTFYGADVDYKS